MTEGDVVLASIPQADGQVKRRPVVLLRILPGYGDLLVCGISSQLAQQVPNFDEVIASGDEDFSGSGLKTDSVVRLSFLAVVPSRSVSGSIGVISVERHLRLLRALADYIRRVQ
jgi:mRNA interferase MazF